MAVTIRDVALRAGVGLGTVSRVLNNSPLVSSATRERVLQAVTDLSFVPSATARRLSLGKTLTIAVIVPFFTRPSFVERLRGVENSLAESDYDLIIYNVETPTRRDACFQNVLRRDRADGVIVISLPPAEQDLTAIANANIPIVFVDAHHPALDSFHRVMVDDFAGGQAATQYLINLGHRRIGFVGDPLDNPFNFTSSRNRFIGYCRALNAARLEFNPAYFATGTHGRFEARHLAHDMLSRPDRPTAIFAASDVQAFGVMEAARDLGLTIPDDLSIVGYDDIEIAAYLGLTTMRQLLFESGKRGVELLLDAIIGKTTTPSHEVLPTELIERSSTAPPVSV